MSGTAGLVEDIISTFADNPYSAAMPVKELYQQGPQEWRVAMVYAAMNLQQLTNCGLGHVEPPPDFVAEHEVMQFVADMLYAGYLGDVMRCHDLVEELDDDHALTFGITLFLTMGGLRSIQAQLQVEQN